LRALCRNKVLQEQGTPFEAVPQIFPRGLKELSSDESPEASQHGPFREAFVAPTFCIDRGSRIATKTGHCDPAASHYLKMLLDGVFGPDNFRSEIIWKRTSVHSSANRYGPVHDTILFYSKRGFHFGAVTA